MPTKASGRSVGIPSVYGGVEVNMDSSTSALAEIFPSEY